MGLLGGGRIGHTLGRWAIAKQLNYTKTSLTPVKMRVDIPGGLSYEAFSSVDGRPLVGSLFLLFESARAFVFWPINNASKTLVDSDLLLKNHLFFIASTRMDINRKFYEESSPKFPLSITKTLDYIGRSSSAITSVLEGPSQQPPYATCRIQTVLVDAKTRKPAPFPDWWREKYAHLVPAGQPVIMPHLKKPNDVHIYRTKVSYSDIDAYLHTNWQSYVGFCMEAFYDNVFKNQYSGAMGKCLESFEAGFRKESSIGNELNVYSWMSPQENGHTQFEIKHDNDICLHARMKHFET